MPDINASQDVVQLTFIRAFEQLDEYELQRDFGVWLCVICKHFILTELYIVVFPEAERIRLNEPIDVDSVEPGEFLRQQASAGYSVASGTTVRSYLLQFNPTTELPEERKILTGEITFSKPIVGVLWNADRLAQTDAVFGTEASQYEFPGRGIETPRIVRAPGAGRDRIFLSDDRCTLSLKLNCSVHLDQIRVLVETD